MFNGFVGNKEAVEMISTGLIAAQKRDDRLTHYLFSGSAGCGKTTLAKMLAKKADAHIAYFNASIIDKTSDIIDVLRQAISKFNYNTNKRRIVVICDEAHSLKKKAEDFILTCVSEDTISIKEKGRIENHQIAREVSGKNDFLSWIFISNRCGEIAQALRTRLLQVDFTKYSDEEKNEIAKNYFLDKKITAPNSICKMIAKRSYNIRQLKSYVDEIFNYMLSKDKTRLKINELETYFDLIGVDENGLNKIDRQYLDILVESNNKASVQTIASKLGIGIKDVQELIEPKLLDLEFIDISSYGRTLTEKATTSLHTNPFMARR